MVPMEILPEAFTHIKNPTGTRAFERQSVELEYW